MDNRKLVELLYGGDYKTIPQIEQAYPPRVLPEGAKVTRFAPSPTGFVHFGSLLPTRVSERLAHQSGGVFYLRIEDTDSKRRVEGAEEDLIRTYSYFQTSSTRARTPANTGRITRASGPIYTAPTP